MSKKVVIPIVLVVAAGVAGGFLYLKSFNQPAPIAASSGEASLNDIKSHAIPARVYTMTDISQFPDQQLESNEAYLKRDRSVLIEQCLKDEFVFDNIQSGLLETLERAILSKNVDGITSLGSENFTIRRFAFDRSANEKTLSGIEFQKWNMDTPEAAPGNRWGKYFEGWKSIDDARMDLVDYSVNPGMRANEDLSFNQAELMIRWDVRGLDASGERRNDRGLMSVTVKRGTKDGTWKISDLSFKDAETVRLARAPAFTNKTLSAGLDKTPIHLRQEAIRRGGYAVSIADINGDRMPDVYVGSFKNGSVWLGNGKGGFTKGSIPAIEDQQAVKAAIFADFRNTGRPDVFMTRFVPEQASSSLSFLTQSNSEWSHQAKMVAGQMNAYDMPMPAAAADFNRDGFLDLYVGFPGSRDFTQLNSDTALAANGLYPQGVFLNLGKSGDGSGQFSDATVDWASFKPTERMARVYPHAAIAADYDNDGYSDIFVIDDRMNIGPVYKNNKGEGLHAVEDAIEVLNRGYGMGIAIGDLNNDGSNDVLVSNVNFVASERMKSACMRHWRVGGNRFGDVEGLRLFQGNKSGKFSDVTRGTGLEWAGEGIAGVEFVDYDNDGLTDIYVANGLWSGSVRNRQQDLGSLFARSVLAGITVPEQLGERVGYVRSGFMRVLKDFQGDVTGAVAGLKARPSMAGWQRNRLFKNLGDGTYLEVGYLEGVDSIHDGYVIAKGDFNADGKMDLIVRNGDPGTSEHQFPVVEYYENSLTNSGNSLTLTLEGSSSNRDAVGALVDVKVGGRNLHSQLVANNGAAQSQMLLHFGLGTAKKADAVTIHWPTGNVQTFKNLAAGHYQMAEGKVTFRSAMAK